MPLVRPTKRPSQRAAQLAPQALWKPGSRKRANDFYSNQFRSAFAPPSFELAGLDDLAGGTGIDFIDSNISAVVDNAKQAGNAIKITMYCSIAAGIASVLLLFRTARR